MKVINSEYKKRNMKIWNEVAPRYHKRWASVNKGPFQSTKKLIELIKINKNNLVLDIACGTGVVTKQIQKKIDAIKAVNKFILNQKTLLFAALPGGAKVSSATPAIPKKF